METPKNEQLETPSELNPDLLDSESVFNEEEYTGEDKAQKARAEYTKEANAVFNRVEALKLAGNNPIKQDIIDHLSVGNIDRARQKLERLEAVKAKTIDEQYAENEQLGEERFNKKLGINQPSNPTVARKQQAQQVLNRYIKGKATEEEYSAARKDLGVT